VTEPVAPYRVVYSERVRQRLKALADEAAQRGPDSLTAKIFRA
jgi:hypothetical protein